MATTKATPVKKAARGRARAQAKVIETGPAGPQPTPSPEPTPMMRLIDDEIPADFQVDEEEYSDADDVVHPQDVAVPDQPQPAVALTTTDNFMGAAPSVVREVIDHGVTMVEGERMYRVRVVIDVGPVYYGPDNLIELKKGKLYEVPESIYRYLHEKDLLWEQQ